MSRIGEPDKKREREKEGAYIERETAETKGEERK